MVYRRGATCDLNTDSYQSFFIKQDSLFSQCMFLNRPLPSSLVPLFQNESKSKTFRMKMNSVCSFMFMHIKVIFIMVSHLNSLWGSVHTNPFANKNGAVLLCFQKNLRPHLPFLYRFTRPHYNAISVLKMLLYPQCTCSNELNACTFQYNYQLTKLVRNWSYMVTSVCHFGYSQ